ncbi:glycoside hydrolase family 43 protein [Actinophytocola oryzae]|uniref:Beta-xylosidase n=1 Tax=Actinophytocola oryzae TaxID=502181 RepID=A0A4R7W5N2_9PSEU|nr:glycoside hydrolase 43 family protein [Actinophytocola oryzae]TDV57565.1 beta-xylosidase [Actinophytocola oryzae]
MDFTNPVLNADWPDPDVVRVGDDYYMVVSSFNRAPGLPVLHSRDLVGWEVVARALPALPPEAHYRLPRHGSGVWAPSIRHHDGTFHITYPDPDHGIFVLSAADPRGPWSPPRLLLAGIGLIDPCPFWDDDGRAYLVHGWAHSRSGLANRLTLVEVDPGLTELVGTPRTVIDGDELPGHHTLEGPKIHRRDGWYWIFAPSGGVTTGWQSVFRARDITGPYEGRVVLTQGGTDVNGPHQGAWVETPDGEHWFLHFQDRGVFGRVVHLQPMTWRPDGWPVIGAAAPDATSGEPVRTHPRPTGSVLPQREPERGDDFTTTTLAPRWYWQANPDPDWCLLPGDGTLHLRVLPDDVGDLRLLPRVLGQQLPGRPSTWTTSLTLGPAEPGTRAGLVVLGGEYAWVGLEETPAGLHVVCRRSTGGRREVTLAQEVLPPGTRTVAVRAHCDAEGVIAFAWRVHGAWRPVDSVFPARAGHWIGADVGLFATAPLGLPDGKDHVAFAGVSVELVNSEEVAK